jgi:hypothetical protein
VVLNFRRPIKPSGMNYGIVSTEVSWDRSHKITGRAEKLRIAAPD